MKQNRTPWMIVGILILVVAIQTFYLWNRAESKSVATVGNKEILYSQWMDSLKEQYGQQVMEELINQQVVYQTAQEMGITVSEEQIEKELAKIKEGYSSDAEFVSSLGSSMDRIKEDIKYNLLLEEIAIKDVSISDEEVTNYYQNNIALFTEPESVYFKQIIIGSHEDAQRIAAELKDGGNFETLAQEQSIDSISASNGGDMGWVYRDDPTIDEAILAVAFEIPAPSISNPISISQGFAIIQVVDKQEERIHPLNEVKEDIRRELALNQVENLAKVLEQLKKTRGVSLNSL